MADYRRLVCPSCGRSYKYRGGLIRHINECLAEGTPARSPPVIPAPPPPPPLPRNYLSVNDVKALYKYWKQ
uniref:C2H2-type domain-containing protein n=1 Tax=Bracon brevicornis TaxID=1563983 RepID=A0A6V7M9R2_9HYME